MLNNKWFKFILPVFVLVILSLTLVFVKRGQSQVQPYYSGDAILYNNRVIVGSAIPAIWKFFE